MTTATQAVGTSGTNQVGLGGLFKAALMGGAIAAVVNAILLVGAKAAGVAMTGEFQPGVLSELSLPPVIISSIVPGLFGALAALGFKKLFAANAARNFGIFAAAFFLLSLGGPASLAQISTSTIVVMELMHLVAAAGIGGMLVRALKA